MYLFIFDLDDVLIHEGFSEPILVEEALSVLNFIKEKGYICSIATHNQDVRNIIKKLNIDTYFSYINSIYDGSCKVTNIKDTLINFPFIERDCVFFFDDLRENVISVRTLGIRSFLIGRIGITLDLIKTVIKTN